MKDDHTRTIQLQRIGYADVQKAKQARIHRGRETNAPPAGFTAFSSHV